ncbi:PecA family PE domain-processing aspartic protease [Mycobacterium sp.]|uniref:PecA family PE domain-processing aspartic protease n=1 Tax=Mycobacterium sp. TaxID=1785 RepID=UPI003C8690A0
MGGAVGAFVAAAAMATGSAAPAKADFEELLDPIIQPLLTSVTDSLAGFDPAAATDITSWTDSLLSSLNSIDLALPLTAEPAAAVAAGAEPADSTATIPLTVLEGTEPAVNASIDGGSSVPLLVDTGSAGLVVPWQDLGSGSELQDLLSLGLPSSFGESGYSGGVDYIYLTYNNVPVDYLGGTGLATDGPVDVEVYSWDPSNLGSLFSNDAYQAFLGDNNVDGILGIADNASGPTTSPFADYGGVLVDIPQNQLVVSATDPLESYASTSGAPISTVLESVNNGTATSVSNDIDSGGVFGTIPSSLVSGSSVPSGTVITVDNAAGQQLYTYTTTGNFDVGTGTGVSDAPTVVSGTSIDSGVIPFLSHPVYIDYDNDTLYFDGTPSS